VQTVTAKDKILTLLLNVDIANLNESSRTTPENKILQIPIKKATSYLLEKFAILGTLQTCILAHKRLLFGLPVLIPNVNVLYKRVSCVLYGLELFYFAGECPVVPWVGWFYFGLWVVVVRGGLLMVGVVLLGMG